MEELITESKGLPLMEADELKAAQQNIFDTYLSVANQSSAEGGPDLNSLLDALDQVRDQQEAMDATAAVVQRRRQQLVSDTVDLELNFRQQLNPDHLDAFIEAMNALEFSESFNLQLNPEFAKFTLKDAVQYVPEYIAPSQVLYEVSPIREATHYNILALPAGHLFLCQIGADCSAESPLVMELCLGQHFQPIHAAACGQDLVSFYQQAFLSPNQKTDVETVLALMETYYGP